MPADLTRWGKIASEQLKAGIPPEEAKKRAVEREVNRDLTLISLYQSKAHSTNKRGLFFGLTFADYRDLMTRTHCAYTGRPFQPASENSSYSLTLERVNPCEGYTPENTIAVTNIANQHKAKLDMFMKDEAIPEEMKLKLLRKAAYQLEKSIKAKG